MELTQEYVKSLFDYRDGFLYWRIRKAHCIQVGDKAGSLHHGKYGIRWTLHFDKKFINASRIIFLWHHGWLPEIVDHRDRDKLNDKIENLRAATPSQNSKNKQSQTGSSSKYLGVYLNTTSLRWAATISINRKNKYLGQFNSEDDAARAYNEMAITYHGEFANLNVIT